MASMVATSEEFNQQVLQSTLPVLVDFWANWCGPCKMMNPVIEELSQHYQGKLAVVKIDVDKADDLAQQYEIRSIPSLLLFNQGKLIARAVGSRNISDLRRWIESEVRLG